MRSEIVRLLKTLEHPCGYYAERVAQNLVIDPVATNIGTLYHAALTQGFRRAGGHVYRPACASCRSCVASRIAIADFVPNRSQRRTMLRNADLTVAVEKPSAATEFYELYRHYLGDRHAGGGMDDSGPDDFERFLTSPWSDTRFVTLRRHGRLFAVAVTDWTPYGLSAVYTFYDTSEPDRSLGTFAILSQIELTRMESLPHLYLGYWLDQHAKMHYKARFRPLEVLRGERWERLAR